MDAGELGGLAHAGECVLHDVTVERLPGEVVRRRGYGHVADAVLAHGGARRQVDQVHVVGVRTAEVAVEGGDLGRPDLLVVDGSEHRRLQQPEAAGTDSHPCGEDRLLVVEGARRFESPGAHGDLALLVRELAQLGDELLARELGRVLHDCAQLLAQGGGVADRHGDALEVAAVASYLAVVLAAARPPGESEDDDEEDERKDDQTLDAGATAVGTAARRGGRGRAARVSGRAAGLVVEEIHAADPPFLERLVGEGGLEPPRA